VVADGTSWLRSGRLRLRAGAPGLPERRAPAGEPAREEAGDEERGERQSFATRTLAEIYLAQGYRDKALTVLRQILARHPDRTDIAAKIGEIEAMPPDAETKPAPARPDPSPPAGADSAHRQHFDAWLERLAKPQERS